MCVCVYFVCVSEREKQREIETEKLGGREREGFKIDSDGQKSARQRLPM